MSETNFQTIVKTYREAEGLSIRKFADALNEKFVNVELSHQTISRWEKLPNAAPDLYFFLNMLATYQDWRASFAADALHAVMPHVFGSIVTINIKPKKPKVI